MSPQLFNLEGKVAVVTGANTGLGQAMATALAGAGARVALTGRSRPDETEALIANAGGESTVIMADLSSADVAPSVSMSPEGDVLMMLGGSF